VHLCACVKERDYCCKKLRRQTSSCVLYDSYIVLQCVVLNVLLLISISVLYLLLNISIFGCSSVETSKT
jgi:hypothetical protein